MYLLRSEPVAPVCHQWCHTSLHFSSFPLHGIQHICAYFTDISVLIWLGCHSTCHHLSYLGFLVFVLLTSVSSCGFWHHGIHRRFSYFVYIIPVLPATPVLPYGIWHHCINHHLRLETSLCCFLASLSSCWFCLVVRQVGIFISSSRVSYALWIMRQLCHSFVHECCMMWLTLLPLCVRLVFGITTSLHFLYSSASYRWIWHHLYASLSPHGIWHRYTFVNIADVI